MQIDFHHGVIYVLSRLAGFSHEDADIVAYSSQYVDDATNGGFVKFNNNPMYYRICTAHGLADTKNLDEQANQSSWVPFHFLPGNEPEGTGELSFVSRLICRPNSQVAQEMVKECIRQKNPNNGLHRLGITMHVYADTWAHQGFAGIKSKVNIIHNLKNRTEEKDAIRKLFDPISDAYEAVESEFLDHYALGHGAAESHPDEPYTVWEYRNFANKYVLRDNTEIFMKAVDSIYTALKRYQAGNVDAEIDPMASEIRQKIEEMFNTIRDPKPWARNRAWLNAVKNDDFKFGAAQVNYIHKGPGSWKAIALDTFEETESLEKVYTHKSEFDSSNWKKFHDAAKEHWYFVIHDLLPKNGIIY